jgi:hypothetical protein
MASEDLRICPVPEIPRFNESIFPMKKDEKGIKLPQRFVL